MNAIQPAAHARAVTGFTKSKAGTGSIVSSAWNRSRLWMLVRFLPLVMLTILGVTPAHADGVSGTIANGQIVSGTVTGAGSDRYSFKIPPGSSFEVNVSETGVHDSNFVPLIGLEAPGAYVHGAGSPLHARLRENNVTAENWTVNVSRGDTGGTTGGSYALTLVVVPGAVSRAGGVAVVALSPGQNYSGTNTRGNSDVGVYTFTGVAGHTETLTLNPTGGEGFAPEISVYSPTGGRVGGAGCPTGCDEDFSVTSAGTYTVLVDKSDDSDVTGTYTLSIKEKN